MDANATTYIALTEKQTIGVNSCPLTSCQAPKPSSVLQEPDDGLQ